MKFPSERNAPTMALRHFSVLTPAEVEGMKNACTDAAVDYAKAIGMSGLSHNGSHNIYRAIQDAIDAEHKHARLCVRGAA